MKFPTYDSWLAKLPSDAKSLSVAQKALIDKRGIEVLLREPTPEDRPYLVLNNLPNQPLDEQRPKEWYEDYGYGGMKFVYKDYNFTTEPFGKIHPTNQGQSLALFHVQVLIKDGLETEKTDENRPVKVFMLDPAWYDVAQTLQTWYHGLKHGGIPPNKG